MSISINKCNRINCIDYLHLHFNTCYHKNKNDFYVFFLKIYPIFFFFKLIISQEDVIGLLDKLLVDS